MGGRAHRARDFSSRVYHKASEDNVFFLAGAISFNVVVAIIPLVLLLVGIWGFVVQARYGEPGAVIVPMVLGWMPAIGGDIDLVSGVEDAITGLVDGRAGFTWVGTLLFVWLSTRLVGTLRIALREVFDIAQDRGFIAGKIFDIQIVVLGGTLMLVNLGITLVLRAVGRRGAELLGLRDTLLGTTEQVLGPLLAFSSIWVLFVLIYRYVPVRRVSWRTAMIAGTVMAV
ncbi:MAG: YihY/virulence factor BrkB family protein, partial [Longimicrobiales bacterium]